MAVHKARSGEDGPESLVFDRAHLAHYTMNSAELEREIIGLFLQQLPSTVNMIETAENAADWRLATHTLKGAAAAVGAWRIEAIALDLEKLAIDDDSNVRTLRVQSLAAAIAEFRDTVRQVYP
jgi:HPt (histidine-containing phosphotransfer) domain-containing protein